MAEFGGEGARVDARIVYWGVEGAGKRSNLTVIHAKLRPDHRGDVRDMPTRLDPTVSYTVLPIELGMIGGVRTRIQIVAVPGAPEHGPTRKQLLDQADGVVFVVDASRDRVDENLASFEELRSALSDYGRAIENVPLVVQYNRKDLGDAFTLEELHRKLSMSGVAAFEAMASEGTAVLQTLTTISKRVIRHLREQPDSPIAAEPEPAPRPAVETPVATMPAPATPAAADSEAEPPTLLLDTPVPDLAPRAEEEVAATASAARTALDASFEEARAAVEEASGDFRIVGVGGAEIAGAHGVRVRLEVEDEQGRRRGLVLHVALEPGDGEAP